MAAISANYPTPVQVNGFTCKNCTDVDYAKKHIDPAHPKSGPYGVDAKTDPSLMNKPSVSFGGALSGVSASSSATPDAPDAPGAQLDITV
jgi:hypothetical protein